MSCLTTCDSLSALLVHADSLSQGEPSLMPKVCKMTGFESVHIVTLRRPYASSLSSSTAWTPSTNFDNCDGMDLDPRKIRTWSCGGFFSFAKCCGGVRTK